MFRKIKKYLIKLLISNNIDIDYSDIIFLTDDMIDAIVEEDIPKKNTLNVKYNHERELVVSALKAGAKWYRDSLIDRKFR